jgi:signal transduction histidine kinase/DNA-binding NarL/FixJ family response regulator
LLVIKVSFNRFSGFLATGRAVQAGWLLFALLALSLALPGVASYRQLLQTVCTGAECLTGQLTPATMQGVLERLGPTLPEYAGLAFSANLLTYGLSLLTAAALIWRKPTQRAAVFGAFTLAAAGTGTLSQASARSVPLLEPAAQLIQLVGLATLLPCFCLIPDGRFHPAWLRWIALAIVPAAALAAFGVVGTAAGNALNILTSALILGSVMYRYRSLPASPQQEQAAWALAAAVLLAGAQWMTEGPLRPLYLEAIPAGFVPASPVGAMLIFGALTCLAVAFLSDEMFRVEVVLGRALVYSLLSLFVVGVYVLVVGYLSLVFQSSGSLWFSLIATGLVALLFQPVRERVQRFVNRLLYGERAEPYEVIAGLGRRLEATFAPEAVLPDHCPGGTGIAAIILRSHRPGAKRPERSGGFGRYTAGGNRFPSHSPTRGPWLAICWSLRGRGRRPSITADRALLVGPGPAGRYCRLRRTPDGRAETYGRPAQQSRELLVLALEDERRRLRRDLHDDLAPTLVGLSLRAGTINELLETDPAKARKLADELESDIRAAVGNIRRLVYDLRPPALDDLGLLAAIRERARDYSSGGGLRIEVEAPDALPPLPAAVEVATYRIVQEGLVNVVKHAQAQTCQVRITLGDELGIQITDDGIGLPATRTAGVGLRSIRERAEELGGTCEVTNSPGSGTRIAVCLPLRGEAWNEQSLGLIADDHPVFRDGIRALLEATPNMEIAGEATTGNEVISLAGQLQPDVILMDVQMPGLNGIEATRQIAEAHPGIRVLVVTMFEDDASVFAAMRAGARGYVLKDATRDEIRRAIQAVGNGEAIFSPAIAARLIAFFASPPLSIPKNMFPELTGREKEILDR